MDLSTAFIMLSFVGVWFLGPLRGMPRGAERRLRYARVVYVGTAARQDRTEVPFWDDPGSVHRITPPEPPETELGEAVRSRPSRILAPSEVDLSSPVVRRDAPWPRLEAMTYAPVWKRGTVFGPLNPGRAELRVELVGTGLRGLQFPEIPDVWGRNGETWTMTADVQVGADGVVEHVFLKAPGVHMEMDTQVVRWLYRARMPAGTAGRRGRVRVSNGPR
jgi:hypothetical protein